MRWNLITLETEHGLDQTSDAGSGSDVSGRLIFETLGIQVNAAKHTIFRAVRKLRESLEPFVRSSTCNT